MRRIRFVRGRGAVTVFLTLALLALSYQPMNASGGEKTLLIGLIVVGIAIGSYYGIRALVNDDDDPPDPSTPDPNVTVRSAPWQPSPAMVQDALDRVLGTALEPRTDQAQIRSRCNRTLRVGPPSPTCAGLAQMAD